jgi:hypothetical protein
VKEIYAFTSRLDEILALENAEPIEKLAGYIVADIIVDAEGRFEGLYDTNPIIQEIGDLASDVEISNGTPRQLEGMWSRIKALKEDLQ